MKATHPARAHAYRLSRRGPGGFTLPELMITILIAAILIAGVAQMTIALTKINFDSVGKLGINKDVRTFTGQLSMAARSTRDFRIYTSTTDLTERQSGLSGDMLVLVWADPIPIDEASSGQAETFYYRRVIVFARTVDNVDANTGPVIRYEQEFPAPGPGVAGLKASTTTIKAVTENMLKATSGVKRSEVIELTRGLANNRLFHYSSQGRSIVVNGELYHGNRAREVTNTYNFTITPRG